MDAPGWSSLATINIPNGVTGLHLWVSLHNASIKGNLGRSSKVGSRSLPVTESSSACALDCRSGRSTTARIAVKMAVTVCGIKKVRMLPGVYVTTYSVSRGYGGRFQRHHNVVGWTDLNIRRPTSPGSFSLPSLFRTHLAVPFFANSQGQVMVVPCH